MAEWTPDARQQLQAYLDRVAQLCREKGDDADDVVSDLNDHITMEAEAAAGSIVTADHLHPVLARMGTPEQVTGVDLPQQDMSFFGIVDSVLRDRHTLHARLLANRQLRQLCSRLTFIFVIATALYGLAMGCFRWIHPQYHFSDYELTIPGEAPQRGKVAGLNVDTRAVYVNETGLAEEAEGVTIRFNVTDPSEPHAVESITEEKGFGKIVLAEKDAMVDSDAGWLPAYVAVKAPALFLLTLLVCLPALYVLNLTFGLRLRLGPTITLMLFALASTGIMLAVFVPIVALFSMVTESYHFTKLMHVLVFAIAGFFGVKVLWEGLTLIARQHGGKVRSLFAAWLLLYCLVGGQISWTLKPWIGTPYLPATPPFRIARGNIYVSAFNSLQQMTRPPGPRVINRNAGPGLKSQKKK